LMKGSTISNGGYFDRYLTFNFQIRLHNTAYLHIHNTTSAQPNTTAWIDGVPSQTHSSPRLSHLRIVVLQSILHITSARLLRVTTTTVGWKYQCLPLSCSRNSVHSLSPLVEFQVPPSLPTTAILPTLRVGRPGGEEAGVRGMGKHAETPIRQNQTVHLRRG
jgi:hypothetical protein